MALRLTSFYQSKGRGIASLLFIFAQVRLFRSFVFHTHQGSASGKRSNGCPEPPTKSPPSPYTREPDLRDGGVRREPAEDSRFQSAHIRKTLVLSKLARTCKFAPSVFSFGPSTARFLFGKTKRKWGVDCQTINIAYVHPIGQLPASAQKKREAHASLFLSALLDASKPFKQTPVLSEWLSF